MFIPHLLCARHCAQHEGFSNTQDRNGLCPRLVGSLAGKTNMPADYGKLYLKIVKKKRLKQNSTAEHRTWVHPKPVKRDGPLLGYS